MPEWKPHLRAEMARLKFRGAREVGIIEELSQHLDDRWREMVSGGMAPDEATRLLRDEISGTDLLATRLSGLRQARGLDPVPPGAPKRRWFADTWQDLRYAARALVRQPGFALAAIVTLALGIGANTAMFTVVNAVLLRRAPLESPDRLAFVYNGLPGRVFSYPGYAAIRDRNDVFSDLVAWGGITASLNSSTEVDFVTGLIVTGNYFETLGFKTIVGRGLQRSDDETVMAHPVVVISHGLWQRRFGGAPDVVGRQISLNGQPFSIVGVVAPEFAELEPGSPREIWVPMMMQPLMRPPRAGYSGEMNPDLLSNPANGWLSSVGRLKPGKTVEQARLSLNLLAAQIDQERRTSPPPANAPAPTFPLVPYTDDPGRAEFVPVARLLLGVVGVVLLIACANVANLLLSRAAARRRETAIRLAMGASRWRLVRQLLTESGLLAVLGGAVGVALAWALVSALATSIVPQLPFSLDLSMDWRVLAFALAVSVLTGFTFGLAPAFAASRPAVVPALKDGAGTLGAKPMRRFGAKRGLVVGQVTLSLLLLITSGLLVRSLSAMQAVNPGFDIDRLASATLNVNLLRYTREQGRNFYRRAVEDVSLLPGVESAALARVAVATGGRRVISAQVEGRGGSRDRFTSEGTSRPANPGESVVANVVSVGFFQTLGIPFVRGRDFSDADKEGSPLVAVISETMAKDWFAGEEAIGQRLNFDAGKGPWTEIIGVAKDSTYASLSEPRQSQVYLPVLQRHETGMTLYVRTSTRPGNVIGSVRRTVQAIEPNLPMPDIRPVSETVGAALALARTGAMLISGFGGVALLLAAVGIYGVLAFSMMQRQREFGVRIALGATRGRLFSLVIREGMWLVVIGATIGLAAAGYGSRVLQTFLFGVSPTDAWTFIGGSTVLILVALVACVIPARRAMSVDPIQVLRG